MACIVVPFKTVMAMSCKDDEVKIQVNCTPWMFVGEVQQRTGIISSLPVFDTSNLVDISGGEASRCSIHVILLKKNQADKLQSYLVQFDKRFQILTQLPINQGTLSPSNMHLPLPGGNLEKSTLKRNAKRVKTRIRKPPEVDDLSGQGTNQVCSCRISCSSQRCSCAKAAQKCNYGRSICLCANCDNPLNILDSMGIDSALAVRDSCLFQNIYEVKHLRRFLQQEIILPCCNLAASVQECIPSTVLCPNIDCTEAVQYSWCRQMLCVAERNPRNHCSICGKCSFSIGKHCEKCNSCYTRKHGVSSCPNCSAEGDSSICEKIHQGSSPKSASTTSSAFTVDDISPSCVELVCHSSSAASNFHSSPAESNCYSSPADSNFNSSSLESITHPHVQQITNFPVC